VSPPSGLLPGVPKPTQRRGTGRADARLSFMMRRLTQSMHLAVSPSSSRGDGARSRGHGGAERRLSAAMMRMVSPPVTSFPVRGPRFPGLLAFALPWATKRCGRYTGDGSEGATEKANHHPQPTARLRRHLRGLLCITGGRGMGSGPGHLLCVVCKAEPAQEGERLGSGPPLPPRGIGETWLIPETRHAGSNRRTDGI